MRRDPNAAPGVVIAGIGCLWLLAGGLSLTLTLSLIVLIWKVIAS